MSRPKAQHDQPDQRDQRSLHDQHGQRAQHNHRGQPRQGRSIRTRILIALLLISLLSLGLTTLLSTLLDLKIYRDNNLRDIQVLAGVVGDNCVSSLVFDSPDTAQRHLATLQREYQVRGATLYDASGAVFARWQRPGAASPSPQDQRYDRSLGRLDLLRIKVTATHPIQFDGQRIGEIVLQARLDELTNELRLNALVGLLIALITFAVAVVAALQLQRRIADPILDLAAKSQVISAQQDFAIRVPDPKTGPEISTLVQGFNAMLAATEQHERALQRQSNALQQANAKLRRLALDISLLEQTERARLATELHDSPMQKLALAQMQISAAGHVTDRESEQLRNTGIELLRESIAELRTLQFDLSPPVLEQRGLAAALRWLAESTRSQWGIEISCILARSLPEISHELSVILYQCTRELVYNMIKHAQAQNGLIRLAYRDGSILLEVEDDGIGFEASRAAAAAAATASANATAATTAAPGTDPTKTRGGFGLYSVRERLALLDGSLSVQPLTPGSRISIQLPLLAIGDRSAESDD
jgi:signal transduction histidine kinase